MPLQIVKLIGSGLNNTVVTGGLVPKGAYNGSTAYAIGDSVSYNGSSYIAIAATTGNLPTDTTHWQLLASKGDTGTGGTAGATGVFNEIPTGTLNGVNTTFTLANTYVTSSTRVYLNGFRQTIGAGNDYTESGATTIQFTSAPLAGDTIIVDYNK